MRSILVEEDPSLRIASLVLDPRMPDEIKRAVTDFYAFDMPDFEGWCAALRTRLPGLYPANVVYAKDQDELRAKIGEVECLIVESLRIGPTELNAAPSLSLVQKWGGFIENIDLAECVKHEVMVSARRRYVNIAVAEHAFALMITLARRICEFNGVVEEKRLRDAGCDPTPFDRRYTSNSNYGRINGLKALHRSVFGALGVGEVGREVASRAHAFGMNVLYHQRHPLAPADERSMGATYCSLEEMLERSDFISIHLPLNPSTRGLLDRKAMRRIKPGAILVNVARAQIIERDALMEALESGRLGGFGLDVGYAEPAEPGEPLLNYKNVILVPHLAVANRQTVLDDWDEMLTKMSGIMLNAPLPARVAR